MKQEFPKWIYGAGGVSRLVASPKEMNLFGEGWYETPADCAEAVLAPVAPEAPVAPPTTQPPEVPADVPPDPISAYYQANASDICGRVGEEAAPGELVALRSLEENRPGGARRKVLRAIADRLASLVVREVVS